MHFQKKYHIFISAIGKRIMPDQHSWVDRIEWEPEHDRGNFMRAMDEIVVTNPDFIHIERMNDGEYWMAICKGDQRQIVVFHTARGSKIFARTEAE
jgi:hypothetical protein